ncbi:MAG: hypothetical protein KA508_05720 [Gammaproteobacteria bacterium]|nr:hypothetical protein [Gammaproteobacteria bacterium]
MGIFTTQVIEHFLNHPTQDLLREAQGVLRLAKRHGSMRLENACKKVFHFKAISYLNLKTILSSGLDCQAIDDNHVFEKLSSVYKGQGLFQRQVSRNIH